MKNYFGIIYKATNIINGKIYIGQTIRELEDRKYYHKYDSINGDSNCVFHRAIRKYGWDNFNWEIIDEAVDFNSLNEKEKHWINYYDSYIHTKDSNGYNSTTGGSATSGFVYSDEQAISISRAKGVSEFLVYNLDGLFIGVYKTISQCAKELNISATNISSVLRGKQRFVRGYVAIFKSEYTESLLNEKIRVAKDTSCQKRSKPTRTNLTEEQVRDIKILLADGKMNQKEIGEIFNVKRNVISQINIGRNWSHISL